MRCAPCIVLLTILSDLEGLLNAPLEKRYAKPIPVALPRWYLFSWILELSQSIDVSGISNFSIFSMLLSPLKECESIGIHITGLLRSHFLWQPFRFWRIYVWQTSHSWTHREIWREWIWWEFWVGRWCHVTQFSLSSLLISNRESSSKSDLDFSPLKRYSMPA